MSWFKKREQTEGTCASMLASQSGSNPLHANLNRERFPWQLTRSALAAKFGIRKHAAYDWDVIEIASDRPLVDNLLWPLSAQAFPQFSPNLPAAQFSGVSYVSDDACENLRAVVSQLQPIEAAGNGAEDMRLSCQIALNEAYLRSLHEQRFSDRWLHLSASGRFLARGKVSE
jgi:hypothetical protein